MRLTAIIGLILVMALVSLSSYLRLDHSGIGCTPWPDCYGNIGQQEETQDVAGFGHRATPDEVEHAPDLERRLPDETSVGLRLHRFVTADPAWPRNVLVGANSPSL